MNRMIPFKRFLLMALLGTLPMLTSIVNGQVLDEDHVLYSPSVNAPTGNNFGRAMAMDAGVLAVGAYYHDFDKFNFDYGSAHLFDISTGSEITRLIPEDGHANSGFGMSIDIDDGIVVVGAIEFDGTVGAVYLFDATTGNQLRKITPPDNDTDGRFAFSVAIDNGVVAVGAPIGGFNPADGAGYVYLFDADTGSQLHKLSPDDGSDGDNFGFSVDIDNGRLSVGAPHANNPELATGAVYVFSVSTGVQIRKFAPDSLEFDDRLGWSVAASGTNVAIGAPANGNNSGTHGAVYIYDTLTHTQISRITPDTTDSNGRFGISVAYDNDIVMVGADYYGSFSGSAFLFNATTGIQAAELSSTDLVAGDYFGSSVAIQGFKTAVGARFEEHGGPSTGAAYIFNTFTGTQTVKVLPSQESLAFDNFGYTIAAGPGVLAISANKNDDRGSNAGAAYLYSTITGEQLSTYYPDAGTVDGNFGYSMDYDSAVVAIGASGDTENGANGGAAYLFFAFTGDRIHRVVPSDGNAGDFFGASVAIDTSFNGGIVAIGSSFDDDNGTDSGSVYLFNPFSGVQLGKLYPNDAAAGDSFGNALAIDDGILAVGAHRNNDLGNRSGSAYLFDLATGNQVAKLLPDDGFANDQFGRSIAIHDGVVAVGAWEHDENGSGSGAVYLFDATTGNQIAELLADDGQAGDRFGYSVSIDNGVVIIGAYRDDDNGEWSGSAYMFGASTGNQLYKLLPNNVTDHDLFGRSVSISNNTIGVSAIGDTSFGTSSGSAYAFTVPDDLCPADLTGDGVLNFFDVSAFLLAFSAGESAADFTGDGAFNFFDVSAFLAAFSAGCP